LQKHLDKEQRKREARKLLNDSLKLASGVETLPGDFLEKISVAYHDLQTSLNNLDNSLISARSLLDAPPSGQISHFPPSQDSLKTSEDNGQSPSSQTSHQETSPYQPPTLNRLLSNLRNLEIRQISLARKYRKLFKLLGFRQSFVDGLEGVVSIYEGESEPEIDLNKNLGLKERNATTQ